MKALIAAIITLLYLCSPLVGYSLYGQKGAIVAIGSPIFIGLAIWIPYMIFMAIHSMIEPEKYPHLYVNTEELD